MNVIATLSAKLSAKAARSVTVDDFRSAAVLVPVVMRQGEPALLFTLRTADLPSHAGQVAFPGGKLDGCDADLAACAVREASEELGIDGGTLELLGRLDDVPVPSRFVITPVVGLFRAEPALRPNPGEVASWFYASFEALRDPAILEHQGTREFMGVSYEMLAYRHEGHLIWGATARIVHQLLELAYGA